MIDPTSPSDIAAAAPIQGIEAMARIAMPDQATQARRRAMTIAISAPIPPRYQVAYGAVRASSPTPSATLVGTRTAAASASTHAQTGSIVGPCTPVGGGSARAPDAREPGSQKMQSQVVRRYSPSAVMSTSG